MTFLNKTFFCKALNRNNDVQRIKRSLEKLWCSASVMKRLKMDPLNEICFACFLRLYYLSGNTLYLCYVFWHFLNRKSVYNSFSALKNSRHSAFSYIADNHSIFVCISVKFVELHRIKFWNFKWKKAVWNVYLIF